MSRPATNFAVAIPGEIQREIGGVSQKMLTQTLRGLECDGLVERQGLPRRSPEGRILPDTARQDAHRTASGDLQVC